MNEKTLLRKVDKFGRIVLPSNWRKKFMGKSNLVIVRIEGERIVIEPIPTGDLEEFIDAFEVDVDPEVFEDYNKLKRTLLGERR